MVTDVTFFYRISYFENKIKIKQDEIEKDKYFGKLVTPLVPNSMQIAFINNLENIIQNKLVNKGIISTTVQINTFS